jgi:hypothetical protein
MCAPASCLAAGGHRLGLALVAWRGWPVLAIGTASLLAALAYMGGPRPIAYTPFGELTVFVFFGLVAVMGTDWVLTGSVGRSRCWPRWPSVPGRRGAGRQQPPRHRARPAGRAPHLRRDLRRRRPRAPVRLLLLGPFALLPVMAWLAGRRPCCCPAAAARRLAAAPRLHRAARPARPSTTCCSAPSGSSCGSPRCCRPARCWAGLRLMRPLPRRRRAVLAAAAVLRAAAARAPLRPRTPSRGGGAHRRALLGGHRPGRGGAQRRRRLSQRWGQPVWSTTSPAPRASSPSARFGAPRPTATRCSWPTPPRWRSTRCCMPRCPTTRCATWCR